MKAIIKEMEGSLPHQTFGTSSTKQFFQPREHKKGLNLSLCENTTTYLFMLLCRQTEIFKNVYSTLNTNLGE